MKCNYCGFEVEANSAFCPRCGNPQASNPFGTANNTTTSLILPALQDRLFFVLCILMSVTCALNLLGGSLNIISILFAVFLWLTYTQAKKGIVEVRYLRSLSGTMYAQYIIVNIAAGCLVLMGIASVALLSDVFVLREILYGLNGIVDPSILDSFSGILYSGMTFLVAIVFLFAAAICFLVNFFTNRFIHRFAKSVYKSVEAGVPDLQYANATKIVLYIIGILCGLGCLGNLATFSGITFLIYAANCAMPIIAATLIDKYILTPPAQQYN